MRVLMLTEYFAPYDFGGSEWSTYYLAKGLVKNDFDVTILTPNYGKAPSKEKIASFWIYRFPFYIKPKNKKQLSPFWQTNLIWIVWTSFWVLYYCLKKDINVIHIQGKYFLPAAFFCKILLRKKTIVTLRDYIILCPLGMCLTRGDKSCDFHQFILNDLKEHLLIYHVGKSSFFKLLIVLGSIRARMVSFILKKILNLTDSIVAISYLEKRIYQANGINNIKVIPNPIDLSYTKQPVRKRLKQVLFAGRLTPGKGPDLLLESIPQVLKKNSNLRFIFFGQGFLEKSLIERVDKLKISKNVTIAGVVDHKKLQQILAHSICSVTPSVWPEPFGRLAIESLSVDTPYVVTSHTGVADFLKKKPWGKIVEPSVGQIAQAIIEVCTNATKISTKIHSDKKIIHKLFMGDVISKYLAQYNSLIK